MTLAKEGGALYVFLQFINSSILISLFNLATHKKIHIQKQSPTRHEATTRSYNTLRSAMNEALKIPLNVPLSSLCHQHQSQGGKVGFSSVHVSRIVLIKSYRNRPSCNLSLCCLLQYIFYGRFWKVTVDQGTLSRYCFILVSIIPTQITLKLLV